MCECFVLSTTKMVHIKHNPISIYLEFSLSLKPGSTFLINKTHPLSVRRSLNLKCYFFFVRIVHNNLKHREFFLFLFYCFNNILCGLCFFSFFGFNLFAFSYLHFCVSLDCETTAEEGSLILIRLKFVKLLMYFSI